MIFDDLEKDLEDFKNKFIAENHIFLYVLRKEIAIFMFILTCKRNKDYVYYKTNQLGYFRNRLENET